jgi:hypothetical protein
MANTSVLSLNLAILRRTKHLLESTGTSLGSVHECGSDLAPLITSIARTPRFARELISVMPQVSTCKTGPGFQSRGEF